MPGDVPGLLEKADGVGGGNAGHGGAGVGWLGAPDYRGRVAADCCGVVAPDGWGGSARGWRLPGLSPPGSLIIGHDGALWVTVCQIS